MRGTEQKLKRQSRQYTEIQYFDQKATERSEVLRQEMMLFDPRPLLLPTRWNAANATALTDFLQDEGEIFPDFLPMFEVEDGNYIDDFGNSVASYDNLGAAQVDFSGNLFERIAGEPEQTFEPLPVGSQVTLRDPRSGGEVASVSIYSEGIERLNQDWPEWRPATFLATIEESFVIGGLSVVKSSGFDEVDQAMRGILRSYFPDLKQLEDGVYLVEIIP